MNRILYLLVGGAFAGAAALAFFQKQDIGRVSPTVVRAVIGVGLAMAAAACFLIYSRRGKQWRARLDRKTFDEDDRVRTKGEVRPPLGP